MLKTNNPNIIFIHANGFPPSSYRPLFEQFKKDYYVENYLLRPLWEEKTDCLLLKDWNLLYNDFKESITKEKKYIGIGHSIGGNIILKTAISNPEYFSKIILLDPTLFIPKIIYMWKFALLLGLQKKIHPWINTTLKRKMHYKNYKKMFKSYRAKHVFSKITDNNLKIYIDSITKEVKGEVHITYPKNWEYQIYKTGLIADMYIWNNIKKINSPCLIIRAEDSNAFLDSSQKKIQKLNPNIQFITLKNSTHLFPLEYPKETQKLIKNFIDN